MYKQGAIFLFTMQTKQRTSRLVTVPIGVIHPNPFQPRKEFDETELYGLADSIRKNGLLQPLSVRRREDGSYELIAGERRLRASRLAGLSAVPCIELTVDDRKSAIFALIENLQRQDLSAFEEAEAIQRLMNEWGLSQQEVAARLGKAQSTVANKLRLLKLTREQRRRIMAAGLTERHARALLRIVEPDQRDDALNEMIARQMNVSDAEEFIEKLVNPPEPPAAQKEERRPARPLTVVRDVRVFMNTLTRAVDTMRRSGLNARTAKSETDDYIEYTITIPKAQLR